LLEKEGFLLVFICVYNSQKAAKYKPFFALCVLCVLVRDNG